MFVEDAVCCEGGGLVMSRPTLTVDIFCSQATSIPADCIQVDGPADVTVVDSLVPNPSFGETFRFTASWLGDLTFNDTLTVSVNTEPSYCKLETNLCSVGATNYDNITEPIEPVDLYVAPPEEFIELLPETHTNSTWLLFPGPTLAWSDDLECTMTSRAFLPQSFYEDANFLNYTAGYQSECVRNSTQIIELPSLEESV